MSKVKTSSSISLLKAWYNIVQWYHQKLGAIGTNMTANLRNKFAEIRTDLNIIIKHAISLSVTLQQPKRPFTLEIFKLKKYKISIVIWFGIKPHVMKWSIECQNSTCTITLGQRVKTASMNSSITETYSSPSRRCSCSPRSVW